MKPLFSSAAISSFVAASAVVISSSVFSPANAASMSFTINDFTGADTQVKFTLDDLNGSGKVQFKVDYLSTGTNTIADIRGIFFNIKDDSLLSGLKIENLAATDVTATKFGEPGKVDSVGSNSNNLNGNGNQKNFFDAGVEIGQEGIGQGKGDIQSTIFTLSHASQALTLAQFSEQNFGVRLMSVGSGNNRNGSSKLKGQAPYYTPPPPPPAKVPEPTTTVALGLFALGALRVAKKKTQTLASITVS
ncbi:MAG: hypothetical protein RMY36_011810 [Nostoc sp. SerVER01]|nr:hypothetical protein [Nostoc sp. SerVER01]